MATYLFRTCSRPVRDGKNPSECMRNVCVFRSRWFHWHIPGMPRWVLAFLHLRQPLSLLQPGIRALGSMVQQWRAKVKAKGGKSSLTGLNNVRIIMVRWRASVLSLGSGDGIPVLVGQNEVCQKWQNVYSTTQYNTWYCSFKVSKSVPQTRIFYWDR